MLLGPGWSVLLLEEARFRPERIRLAATRAIEGWAGSIVGTAVALELRRVREEDVDEDGGGEVDEPLAVGLGLGPVRRSIVCATVEVPYDELTYMSGAGR